MTTKQGSRNEALPLEIHLCKVNGEELIIDVNEHDCIEVAKTKMVELDELPGWATPRWVLGGVPVERWKTFAACGLKSGDKLDVWLVAKEIKVRVDIPSPRGRDRDLSFSMHGNQCVHDLWQKIKESVKVRKDLLPVMCFSVLDL